LGIELHKDKTHIINIYRGIDFVGFRDFPFYKLLRTRNIRGMKNRIKLFEKGVYDFSSLKNSFDGWRAYAVWADSFNLSSYFKETIIDILWEKV